MYSTDDTQQVARKADGDASAANRALRLLNLGGLVALALAGVCIAIMSNRLRDLHDADGLAWAGVAIGVAGAVLGTD